MRQIPKDDMITFSPIDVYIIMTKLTVFGKFSVSYSVYSVSFGNIYYEFMLI